jgi:hypothetical protein
MFIALNRIARKQRRRLMMLAAMLALCGAVVVAHGAMGGDHMDGGTMMCVAVLEVAALTVAAVASGPARALLSAVWVRLPRLMPALPVLAFPPEPRARAAPAVLQVFRL